MSFSIALTHFCLDLIIEASKSYTCTKSVILYSNRDVFSLKFKCFFLQCENRASYQRALKKVSNAKICLEKAIKMFFDLERCFDFRRIRDIRVRDIEIRLYNMQRWTSP